MKINKKKKLKKIVGALFIIIALLYGSTYITKNRIDLFSIMVDRVNPFVSTHTVYGILPDSPNKVWKDSGNGKEDNKYKVMTVTDSGMRRTVGVTFFGTKPSTGGQLLKIKAKGQFVSQYEYTSWDKVPEKVKELLEGK